MKIIFMWVVVVSVSYYVSFATQIYYITTNHGNCSVENETLKPCYTLSQLAMEDVLSSSKDHSIELAFLPGTHQISKMQSLMVSNFSEVVFRPFTEKLKVVIQCQPIKNSNLAIQYVVNLNLYSLHFTSCSLQHELLTDAVPGSVNITKCVFETSKSDYAVSLKTNFKLNVTVNNCTFSSNSIGAMRVDHAKAENRFGQLQIIDTVFQDNGKAFNDDDDLPDVKTLFTSYTLLIINNSKFINNTNLYLCIVDVYYSSLVLANTVFYRNKGSSPLLLYISNANISNCQFVNNSGSTVITMSGECEMPESFFINNTFRGNNNTAIEGTRGGAIYVEGGPKLQILNCEFKNNSAAIGGAIYLTGGDYAYSIRNSSFSFNKAEQDGGAIYCDSCNGVSLRSGSTNSNYAKGNGGSIYISNSRFGIGFYNYRVSSNKASNGGAIYAVNSVLEFDSEPQLNISPVITIDFNNAERDGGGFYFLNSALSVSGRDLQLLFQHNAAVDNGGAIFISDQDCENTPNNFQCFLQSSSTTKNIGFKNNTASKGPVLYGGLLDRCTYTRTLGIDIFKHVSKYDPIPRAITSEAVRVCLCTDDFHVNCSIREMTLRVPRGQTMHLLGVAIDQDSNPVQSFIKASYNKLSAQLGQGESKRGTDSKCSNLSYHVFTANTSATLMLRPEGYCENTNFSDVAIFISVTPCSTGFQNNGDRCGCDERLANFHIIICNIDTYSMQKQRPVWVRYDQEYLKVHANCPLDYCNASQDTISIAFPDEQCANHRSGVLCGACQDNYSIALGGSKCLQCTSNYTVIWLIPVFALAGIALLAFLFVCNMTISHGTLNGLIFYANVVSITGLTSLQNCSVFSILSIFIAWVNLDLGVETCFYSGMDTYQKTWLQFVFPLYIWLLVGAVILASQCSMTVVKLFGRSSIAVLATLFLLSYSKILKTIITALNFTEVFQGSANYTSDPALVPYNVWAYDGNLEYLKGKHVPLFAVAMVFLVVLFLPYTLLLTFGQCLRSLSTRRRYVPRCIRSTAFISIMDAYHAPFNKRHRYWTGLLLLTRCVLYLAFATSYTDDQLLSNMYITNLVLIVILTLNILRVYKNFFINLLEAFFLLNLAVLSGTLYYLKGNGSSDENICKCTSASISFSVVLFGGILIYHTFLQIKKTQAFSSLQGKWYARRYNTIPEEENARIQRKPTSTTVQWREELLESGQQ